MHDAYNPKNINPGDRNNPYKGTKDQSREETLCMRQGHMYMTRMCPYIKHTNKLTKNKPTGTQFRIKTGLKLSLSCFTKETQLFKEVTSPH